jgi:Holliday junction resolvase RusA-like endonuclease
MQLLTVPVKPVPKGRHQVRLYRGGVVSYTPQKTREYEKKVRAYAKKQRIKQVNGKVAVVAVFYTSNQGDVDNLTKSLLDALNGVAWEDDRQVKAVVAEKRPCPRGQERTEVLIMSMAEYEALAWDIEGVWNASRGNGGQDKIKC